LLGQSGQVNDALLARLTDLAGQETTPQVRSQLASTAQQLGKLDTLPLLHALMKHKEDTKDPNIPLLIWLAYEPKVTSQLRPALEWLNNNAAGNAMVTDEIVPRAMRRLAGTGKAGDLEACVTFVGAVAGNVRRQALEGLAQALKGRQVDAP